MINSGTSYYSRKLALASCAATSLFVGLGEVARSETYIRDETADTGAEPNPSSGAMWLSPDIWVRNDPMPGWNPTPYNSSSPPAWLDTSHQNPDYRSPLSGKPNYIYVRVRNRNTVSTGTDRLTLYWASASTGLSWDPAKLAGSFVDNVQGGVLFGAEVTKPRKNAATATQAERDAYLAAVKKIATDPAFRTMGDPRPMFAGGRSYWHTQQEIHRFGPTNRHGFNGGTAWVPSVAFLPWHREFINRYEGMLQEADPKVKLLYWNWTQNPVTGPLDYSANFMGSFGAGGPASAVQVGTPLTPDLDAAYPMDTSQGFPGLTQVRRRLQVNNAGNSPALAQTDTTVVNRINYSSSGANANTAFSGGIESSSHNNSHVYVSSTFATNAATILNAGDQLFQPYASRDPFFFMLHAKVDELWARWQRKSGSLQNLDPATTYGLASADANIAATLEPWNGTAVQMDGLANGLAAPELAPWTASGGQIYAKPANDRSVTSPPFYDTAPLTVPAMQAGEEIILEIPWYPPNPGGFSGTADPQHVCLIARIETASATPFGMTTAESNDINANTKNNNNIAWRNVSVVDSFPGPFAFIRVLVANGFREQAATGLRLDTKLDREAGAFFRAGGMVQVDLGRELFARWRARDSVRGNLRANDDGTIMLTGPDAVIDGLVLQPGEQFSVRLKLVLGKDYKPSNPGKPIVFDIVQFGTPRDRAAVVGGQRVEVHTDKIALIDKGREWKWKVADRETTSDWMAPDFREKGWATRKLDLGWVEASETDMVHAHHRQKPTTYYFRKTFEVEDPSFFQSLRMKLKRSDGAVAYLNGREIYRYNVSQAGLSNADKAIDPLDASAYVPVKIDPALLQRGQNVLAVEIHVAEQPRQTPAFDATLLANEVAPNNPPVVRATRLTDGGLVMARRPVTLDVDALVPQGRVANVTVAVDGKRAGTTANSSHSFNLGILSPGVHRLQITATGEDGSKTDQFLTVRAVKAIPPKVQIVEPSAHIEVARGQPIELQAMVSDESGRITRVDYFIHDSYIIGSPGRMIGSSQAAPYKVVLEKLTEPHAMIVAVAYSSSGERTASTPIMALLRK